MGRPSRQRRKRSNEHPKLEPRVVHVSEATIRKKWKKLPTTHHATARELILSVQEQSRARRGKAGIDHATEESVQRVVRSLTDKLPRIPYPLSTDEQFFDHEANLHRMNRLEEQLNSTMHSINLLTAQVAKEEKLCRQDEAEVALLEKNHKSSEIARRSQSKVLHPIARDLRAGQQGLDPLALVESHKPSTSASFACLFRDEDMLPLLERLQSHLDNMNNNISAVKEVKLAVTRAGLELQNVVVS